MQWLAVAVAVKLTASGAAPVEGAADAAQETVQGAVTVTVPVFVQVRPLDTAVRIQL